MVTVVQYNIVANGLFRQVCFEQVRTTEKPTAVLTQYRQTDTSIQCYMYLGMIIAVAYSSAVESLYSGHPWDSLKCPD